MSLKQKAISGVKWTTLSSAVIAILQLFQLMVLARFLSPHDFGLVAILMVIINLTQIFVDFGLSNSIIFKKNISQEQLSTLYWLNIIISLSIVAIIYFSSGLIADFYDEAILKELIILVSSVLVIQAFGQQFRTIFQKELEFNILAKIDIFASTISVFSAILLAWNGFGIYSLIYSLILMALLKSILLIYKGSIHHKIKLIFKFKDIKEFLSFGLYVVGNGMVSVIATQIDVILIGKLLGTEALGIYSVTKELILRPSQLINPIITKVSFPLMAKVNDNVYEVRRIYLKLVNYVSSVNFPIYVFSIILAPEIITLFLGSKWLETVPLFQVLAVWALLRSRDNPIGSLVMSLGKPQYEMYWNIFMMVYMPIMIYISSHFGIIGIAYGNLISILILFIPGWYFLAFKLCNVSLKDYFMCSFTPLIISCFSGIIVYIFLYIGFENLLYKVFVTLIIGSVILYFLYRKYNRDFYNILFVAYNQRIKNYG